MSNPDESPAALQWREQMRAMGVMDWRERLREMGVAGPWDNEPDRVEFQHAGLACILDRGKSGAWWGYVGVPKGHPAFGKGQAEYRKDINPLGLDVHGGVTDAYESGAIWWLGFDCAHAIDLTPVQAGEQALPDHPTWIRPFPVGLESYRDLSYVTEETKSLAQQLADMVEAPG